jgi:hypothetical protein
MASSQINDQFAMHTRQPMGNKLNGMAMLPRSGS